MKVREEDENEVDNSMLADIKNEPNWQSLIDDETGLVYFYNRVTKQRRENKPADFDGLYVIGDNIKKDQEYENTFGDFGKKFCTPMPTDAEVKTSVEKGHVTTIIETN